MHLITRKRLLDEISKFPDAESSVRAWCQVVEKAVWTSLEDVRLTYPAADGVGNFTVFNIRGNRDRLIVSIDYESQVVYFKYFLTHAEYDKDKWKKDPYF